MGAFFLLRRGDDAEGDRQTIAKARATFAAQGFSDPDRLEANGVEILLYRKICAPEINVYRAPQGGFAFATGTLIYKGRTGAAALAEAWSDFDGRAFAANDARGHYCLAICKLGALTIFNDPLGIYHVYHDREMRALSSSFLATLDAVRSAHVNDQAVYEYVFQEATYGGETVFDEVRLLDCAQLLALAPEPKWVARPEAVRRDLADACLEGHIQRCSESLGAAFDVIAAQFAERTDTALSGGYDSRLILALLRARDVRPRLHVYGRADDDDVAVARAIAQSEGLDLAHVDKSALPTPAPDELAEIVARNYYLFDGVPPDGIFDNGADLAQRRDRARNGSLMLNGGGGEIFRNFFYLPNRRFGVRQFLHAFFSRFDPASCGARFDGAEYYRALAAKIGKVLGHERNTLARKEIEYLFPAFRCRFWMGRNNSANNRLGWTLTPFIEPALVEAALAVPLALKNHGLFEGRLIAAADPALARYASVYGHDFAGVIPFGRKLKDIASTWRPTYVRRLSYRLRQRLGIQAKPFWADPAWLGRLIDTGFPYMRQYFDVGRVRDPGQLQRICTLEYLFERLAARAA